MKNKIPILDNGHGGVIGGVYQTAGKRSNIEISEKILYEGMFNRWFVNRVIENLDRFKVPYYHISSELKDISLYTRCQRAEEIYKKEKNTYLFSVHANAGGGKGIEGFTSTGHTESDIIGEYFLKNIEKNMKNQKMRFDYSDGDRDKEIDFYLLRNFSGPAFLLEAGFMDNKEDLKNLWDSNYLKDLVNTVVEIMIYLY